MRSYPANVREYARRLYEANGWSAYRIRKALEGRVDPLPSENAIRGWVDPESREIRNHRRRRPGAEPGPHRVRLWEYRLERIRKLRKAGVTYACIARVMNLDFDLDLTDDQVRHLLNRASPKSQRKHLYPEAA